MDCTRVTIKTQTTSLTLPKDLWRTLEAVRHHNLHLAEEKVNNSVLSLPTYFQAIERIRKEQGLHPLKNSKSILFPYSRDINHYGVWWVEDMFSKHADTFSTKSEIFDLPNFQDLILPPIQENDNDENPSPRQNVPFSNYRCSPI